MNQTLLTIFPSWGGTILTIVGTLVLLLLLSKFIFGWVFIKSDKSGIVEKIWSNKGKLPQGRIIATNGEAGVQANLLTTGLHFGYWPWMYKIRQIDFVSIRQGHIGVVYAKNGKSMEPGRILAIEKVNSNNFQDAEKFLNEGGIMGIQTDFLRSGDYRINTELFNITEHPVLSIPNDFIGIVTTLDGDPLDHGEIAATKGVDHNKFQDADKFLNNGGKRGLQEEVLLSGEYYINPEFATVSVVKQTTIEIGEVGVVVYYIGDKAEDISGDSFKHGQIVSAGQKGIQQDVLHPGRYPINPHICQIEKIPTTNIVLNWATAKTESHNLDKNLSTITARTKDGFSINLDVSQVINISDKDAPKVISRFGSLNNMISQVLEPTIGNYFRNSSQQCMAMEFIETRAERQSSAKEFIRKVLEDYNVVCVDTLIGDIIAPPQLLEPIRAKHVAEQQDKMYTQQTIAEKKRKELEQATAEADMQPEVIQSQRKVEIAQRHAEAVVKEKEGFATAQVMQSEADSKSLNLSSMAEANATKIRSEAQAKAVLSVGEAEAKVIEAKGTAEAKGYEAQVKSMGEANFGAINVTKHLSENKMQLTPYIVNGGSGNSSDNLMAMIALENMGVKLPSMLKDDLK